MTPTILVDTNIASYAIKGDTRAELYEAHIFGEAPALSFFSVGELYRWTVKYQWQAARLNRLTNYLESYQILHSDDETCWVWARLMCVPGRPIEPGDAWIAATALRHGIPLVSHNRSHFDHIVGLDLISEA